MFNLYGPTETNVCTVHRIGELPDDTSSIPIGRACPYSEIWAIADDGKIAGPGETAELFVGGQSVMDGYWGRQDETERLLGPCVLPDGSHRSKVYRTGDLVTIDPDGNYVFLGRRDEMIKRYGYRVELGEIEAIISDHDQVQETGIVAIPDEQIGCLIRAVVVLRPDCKLSGRELKTFCSEHLPAYMIPDVVEFSDSLPRTPTGKIDKVSLRDSGEAPPQNRTKGNGD